jgi:inner membrane transporter RhtA
MAMAVRRALARSSWAPIGALLLAMLSFTSGAAVAKRLFPVIGPEGVTALRLTMGALILAAVWRPWRVRLGIVTGAPVLLYGLSISGITLLYYMSLKTLSIGVALALQFTGPLTLAVLSSRRRLDFVWIAFAVAGLALLTPRGGGAAPIDPTGAALALGAGACWAIYILIGRKVGRDHGPGITSLGVAVAALVALPIGLAHAGVTLFRPWVLMTGLLVALLSTVASFTFEMFALRRLPTRTYGVLTSAEPAVGAIVGGLALGEALPLGQWAAIALIIVASVGSTLTAVREGRNGGAEVALN